jgi:hypothetical protein
MAVAPVRNAAGKKPVNRAPQKRTFHFFIKVVDEHGEPISGAKLKVERIITDARKVIEFMDTPEYADMGLTRVKHEIISTKRGEQDGATQVG